MRGGRGTSQSQSVQWGETGDETRDLNFLAFFQVQEAGRAGRAVRAR